MRLFDLLAPIQWTKKENQLTFKKFIQDEEEQEFFCKFTREG